MMSHKYADYQRGTAVEKQVGIPDFDYWALYEDAVKETTKDACVNAFHLINAAADISLDVAKRHINTYTKALYKQRGKDYLKGAGVKWLYAEKATYSFIYAKGAEAHPWGDSPISFLKQALDTAWAIKLMSHYGVQPVQVRAYLSTLLKN
jgi:hypothetical protein